MVTSSSFYLLHGWDRVLASPGRCRDGATLRQRDSCLAAPSLGVPGVPEGGRCWWSQAGRPATHGQGPRVASVGGAGSHPRASSPAGAVQHDGERHQLQQPLQPRFDTQLLPGGHDGPDGQPRQPAGHAAARLPQPQQHPQHHPHR